VARPPDVERRRALLDALIDAFADGGIGDRPLREIAEAVGTSHRMLLHHFGSRGELLVTIVNEIERRQMSVLSDAGTEPADAMAAMWADVRRPELRPFERLFFECYARGAQGEEPFARMHPLSVDRWTDQTPETRLGLAVTRGLLLDLVATNDRKAVTEAAELYTVAMQRRSVRDKAVRSIGLAK